MVIAYAERHGVAKDDLRANFCIDPIIADLSVKGDFCCNNGEKCFARIAELIKATDEYKHVRIVNVSGATFSNAGSTIVEELAFSLSAAHEYIVRLTDLGLSIDQVARKIRFSLAVTSNYFLEMAKFRAARLLWANIVKGYNPEKECSCKMFAHATTSAWNQTVYDPYVNMLRGTTEAMSAAIAGVHSLEVTPFDYAFEAPTEFSMRIARNTELLLKHESHMDHVVDPAGGSYYIENLTKEIAEQAWALFREIEDKGGYIEAFRAGAIVERVKASAATKDKNIATRRLTLLGANQYPNFNEVADKAIAEQCVTRAAGEENRLTPYRGAMAFEAMRLKVDRSGKTPKAFMLTCGSLAMASRTRAVLLQLLRMRRHTRNGQYVLQVDRGGCRGCHSIEGRDRRSMLVGRRLRNGSAQGQGAAGRPRHSGGCGRTRMRTRIGSSGHYQLHQRQEQRFGDFERLFEQTGYLTIAKQ